VRLNVTNVGSHEGTDVIQGYVKYPGAAGEPPEQLKTFARVTLLPLATRAIALTIPISDLSIFLHSSSRVLPGRYQVNVGQSSPTCQYRFNSRFLRPTSLERWT